MEIYHRPTCSKSRSALQILHEMGYRPMVLDYGKTGLSKSELRLLLNQLQNPEISLLRKKDAVAAGIPKEKFEQKEDIIEILNEYPALLERPILRIKDRAWILRPDPESLLKDILQGGE